MFRLHSSKAPSDRSTSTARVVFTRAAAVMPRQPVPAHRSKIRVWPGFSFRRFMASWASISVSTRGIRASGLT